MRTLYDSESFAVLHLLSDVPHDGSLPEDAPRLARHGFEIVDKRYYEIGRASCRERV